VLTLLRLRAVRLQHRLRRRARDLAVYFDPWSVVHYLFAAAAFGPGLYQYWADPPDLPAVGLLLLGLWPLLGLVIGWGWAVSQGLFGAAATVPLPFSRADVLVLLTSPVDRGFVVLERFVTGWWRRAAGPVGLVVLFAVLTAGYRAVAISEVAWLALTLVWLALGSLGLRVIIFALGPGVGRFLRGARQVGQVLALVLSGAALAFGLFGTAGGVARPAVQFGSALENAEGVLGAGAVWPAAVFALVAAGLAWLLAGRQDLALWAGDGAEAGEEQGRKRAPLPGFARDYGAFRWKHRAALRKRPLWQWVSRFALPVAGALLMGPMGSRMSGAIGAVMAALALYQGARFLAAPAAQDMRNISRLSLMPASMSAFVKGTLVEVSLWLLLPSLAAWWLWGAGWVALAGGPVTAFVMAVLALQQEWSAFISSLSVGSISGDASFSYLALTGVILLGEYLMRLGSPTEMLLLVSASALLGGIFLLVRLHWDLVLWKIR
jgi:hypothetical protein